MTGLRVALVEDHDLFAETMSIALRRNGHHPIRVPLAERRSVGSLVAPVVRARPEVALLDLELGMPGSTPEMIADLVAARICVVVITGCDDRARWGECLHRGARRVLPKTAPLQDVMSTLRRIQMRLPVMSRDTRAELIDAWRRDETARQAARERLESLSRRERVILGRLVTGHTVAEIADVDVVSPATVRSQVKSILAKLEVTSQLRAVAIAHRAQWDPVDA